jgi:hypothetical protein
MFKKLSKDYVSDLDQFLAELHQSQALSPSQQAEVAQHQKIARLRDHADTQPDSDPFAF